MIPRSNKLIMIIQSVTCQVPASQILRRRGRHSVGWLLKAMLNRCVFSLDLKVAYNGLDCTSLGWEFHTASEHKNKPERWISLACRSKTCTTWWVQLNSPQKYMRLCRTGCLCRCYRCHRGSTQLPQSSRDYCGPLSMLQPVHREAWFTKEFCFSHTRTRSLAVTKKPCNCCVVGFSQM